MAGAKSTGCFEQLGGEFQLVIEEQTSETSPGTATFLKGSSKIILRDMEPIELKEVPVSGVDSIDAKFTWGFAALEDQDKQDPVLYVWCTWDPAKADPDMLALLCLEEIGAWQATQ